MTVRSAVMRSCAWGTAADGAVQLAPSGQTAKGRTVNAALIRSGAAAGVVTVTVTCSSVSSGTGA